MWFNHLRRREFIPLLGGAAASWPIAARAQQGDGMRRIGVLMNLAEHDPESQARLTALREGLQKLGWTEGRNIRIEYQRGMQALGRLECSEPSERGSGISRDPARARRAASAVRSGGALDARRSRCWPRGQKGEIDDPSRLE